MARKVILALLGVVAVMVIVFKVAGVRIDPSIANIVGTAGPPPQAVEAAKQALSAEPKIKDFIYQPGQAVEWQVGVFDDGTSRVGYASYICQVLDEHGVLTPRTHVRVVDIVKVSQGANFRSASLGHVACADFRVFVP
jgi:hypothetical protein